MGDMVLETIGQEAGAFLEIKDGNALVIRQLPGPWWGQSGVSGSSRCAEGIGQWPLLLDPESGSPVPLTAPGLLGSHSFCLQALYLAKERLGTAGCPKPGVFGNRWFSGNCMKNEHTLITVVLLQVTKCQVARKGHRGPRETPFAADAGMRSPRRGRCRREPYSQHISAWESSPGTRSAVHTPGGKAGPPRLLGPEGDRWSEPPWQRGLHHLCTPSQGKGSLSKVQTHDPFSLLACMEQPPAPFLLDRSQENISSRRMMSNGR